MTADEETCPHHWLIDRPQGGISRGTCKLCGLSRDFKDRRKGGREMIRHLVVSPRWERRKSPP